MKTIFPIGTHRSFDACVVPAVFIDVPAILIDVPAVLMNVPAVILNVPRNFTLRKHDADSK